MESSWDPQFIDNLAVLGFIIGIMNYNENLSQSDKDDIMHRLDVQTQELLNHVDDEIAKQNKLLEDILDKLNNSESRGVLNGSL